MNGPPVCLLLGATLLALTARAQEWPRFRGPNGTGLGSATNLPMHWTATDYQWQLRLPGAGHSSPVLWGARLFVTCADAATGQWRLVCVDSTRGTVAWQKAFPLPVHSLHRNNTFATATAAVDAQRVYVPRIEGKELRVLALAHDGTPAWEFNAGPFQTEHGLAHSPIRQGNLLIFAADHDLAGRIVALDAASGRLVWERPRSAGRADYSTPCLFRPEGGAPVLIFNTLDDGVSAVDPASGRSVWSAERLLSLRSVSSPVSADGLLISSCGSGGGGNYVVALRPPAQPGAKPAAAYEVRKSAPYVPTPLAVGPLLFLWSDGGIVTCLESATGKTFWQERVGGNYFSSPVCTDGKLYGVSAAGEVVVLAAAREFQELGRGALGEPAEATPAIANGRIYFRTLNRLLCLGPKRDRPAAPAGEVR
jgi:outer membrane protein assembly factor BamB